MSTLRNSRDSFVQFLVDNITDYEIHHLHYDAADPNSNIPQVNAINVAFHNVDTSSHAPSTRLVTIDVISDSEYTADDMVEKVAHLLYQGAQTPLLDYSSGTPVSVSNLRINWDTEIKFRTVHSDNYFHLSALLHLTVVSTY